VAERWATFDCYGTLIDWDGGVSACLAETFPDADVSALLARYHEVEPRIQADSYHTYRDVLDLCLAELASEQGASLDHRGHALSDSLASWPAHPEVPSELQKTRDRGWRLAILSNCDVDLLQSSLPHLEAPFDLVIVAEQIRSYKPAHAHWERFRQETGADPAHHIHVAASLFHDIAPTNDLGIRNIWINRLNEDAAVPPTRELSDLRGLGETLDELVPA
jgi:2-haloacid dehalogenase